MNDDQQLSARQMVGARLRQLRLQHNLKQATAAETIDASIAKISRMECGYVPFQRRDLLDLLTLYGVTDPYQQETLISVALGQRAPAWWDGHDVPLDETVLWSHEQAADLIRTYQPHLVPELLRTEEYAQAAHQAGRYPPPPEPATKSAVANLLRRQQMLRDRGTTLWAVIDEPALWRPIGGDLDAHIRQLDALAAASRAQNVTIQIVPMESPYLPSSAPFTIFRLPGNTAQILAVHRYAGDEIADLQASEQHGLLFDQLIAVAAPRRQTPQILTLIRDHLRIHAATQAREDLSP